MKKFLTFLFAFCIFATAFAVSTPALAHADERTPLTGGVYYFTDNPNSYAIATYLETNTSNTYNTGVNFHYVPFLSANDSEGQIQTIYQSGGYNQITNAYVIIECYYKFKKSENGSLEARLSELKTIFSTLKLNGCETMFVCATDQNQFIHNRNFLNYVDLHIDTDAYYTFITSALYRSSYYYDAEPIGGFNMYLNQSVAKCISPHFSITDSYFYTSILAPYLEYTYATELTTAPNGVPDLLNYGYSDYFINLRLFYQDNDFYNLYNDDFGYDTKNVFDIDFIDNNISFIVSSFGTQTATSNYINHLLYLRDYHGSSFPIYFYNEHGYQIEDQGYQDDDVFMMYGPYVTTPTLQAIMLDFIDAEDVTVYDNWSGRCELTHKMSVGNGEGWLLGVVGDPYWQLTDDPEVEE